MPTAGQSLQVIDPAASNDAPTNWRATTPSPGGVAAPVNTLVCTKAVVGANAVLSFSGLRGTISEQLRRRPDTWVATTTGASGFTVVNGGAADYFVRVRGTGFASPYQDVSCT